MTPIIGSYPPLGQVTRLRRQSVTFVTTLEVPADQANRPWQVAVWHSTAEKDIAGWEETGLVAEGDSVVSLHHNLGKTRRLQFSKTFSKDRSFNFTVKYRSAQDQPWIWARDSSGLGDGRIIIDDSVTGSRLPENLSDVIQDLNSDLKVTSLSSQAPQTKLWSVGAAVPGAQGEDSALVDIPLGVPWNGEHAR
jgi:hypothetical protein